MPKSAFVTVRMASCNAAARDTFVRTDFLLSLFSECVDPQNKEEWPILKI